MVSVHTAYIPISIHALREEGDLPGGFLPVSASLISIHALREEGDQSYCPSGRTCRYFYPRPPRGGRRAPCACPHGRGGISIHALREEGDLIRSLLGIVTQTFLSTPSARRATVEFGT